MRKSGRPAKNSKLIVVDNNVFIAGLLGSLPCRRIISLINRDVLLPALSPILLEEFCFVIDRPKFHNLIAKDEKTAVVQFLKSKALFVKPKMTLDICRDKKDNKLLECALEAGANDLLTLSPFKEVEILPPSQFLRTLKTP